MKKLLFKCALLALLVGAVLYGGGAAYKRTNVYRNLERTEDTEKFRDMPESIDIAVFGASHGAADFKETPEGAVMFNFALSSQTPQYDLAVLRQFQDRVSPGGLVILTVSYLSPYWTDTEKQFQEKQPRYYRVLSPGNIVNVDRGRYWLERLSPLLTLEPKDLVSAFLVRPELIPTSDERSGHTQLSAEKLADEQNRIQRYHWPSISPVYPDVNPVMWAAFHDLLDLCQEKSWNAVLVTPPYLEDYSACFPEGFYESFLLRMEALSREYGVPYLDYSHDPSFAMRYDLYKDIDHLNLEGAAVFDARFFADLQALGDGSNPYRKSA